MPEFELDGRRPRVHPDAYVAPTAVLIGDVELGAVAPELVELAFDPQTAGGLLVSLPRDRGPALEAEFARAGLFLARIGAVEDGTGVVLS